MRFLQPTLFSFRAGKLPLRVRLGVYFLSFVLILLIILLTLLFIFDFLPASQKKIGEDMDDYLTVYERINENAPIQFICSNINVRRPVHENKYYISVPLVQNIDVDYDVVSEDEDGNMHYDTKDFI